MTERVECHSGAVYAERPTALRWDDQLLEITLIETQWRSPGVRCFRVNTQDNQRFELQYDECSDCWQIIPLGILNEEERQ